MVGYSKKVIIVCIAGVLGLFIFRNTPISIPCIFKLVFNIPCPGCGLTRAFILISRLEFADAFRMNILAIPLFLGGAAYFVCAVVEAFTGKEAIQAFNSVLSKKWVIAVAAFMMAASWYYNIMFAPF